MVDGRISIDLVGAGGNGGIVLHEDKSSASFRRALVVFDTVDDAVSFYRTLGEGVNKLLIHSRFTPSDRRHEALLAKQMESGIIVGTQAIEAGMDFSNDLIISELAPARWGRRNPRGGDGAGCEEKA